MWKIKTGFYIFKLLISQYFLYITVDKLKLNSRRWATGIELFYETGRKFRSKGIEKVAICGHYDTRGSSIAR